MAIERVGCQGGRKMVRFSAMRTTFDAGGRIVIPKALRHELGLQPGVELEIREHDGVIEIEPAATI
jgi:AbrB family looped-hinge helix DNA binding protein